VQLYTKQIIIEGFRFTLFFYKSVMGTWVNKN